MIHLKATLYYCRLEVITTELKAFTKGIDSSQLQLLCRSSDNGVPLDDIIWTSRLNPTLSIPNPFIINTLSNDDHYLRCNRGSDTPIGYIIIVQGKFKHIYRYS